MKKLTIVFGLLTLSLHSMAQYDKASFLTQINLLSVDIDRKALADQNTALSHLSAIMQKVIAANNGNAATKATKVPAEQQVLQYVQSVPRNKIVADKKALMDELNKFAATY